MFRLARPEDLQAIAAIYDAIHDLIETGVIVNGWVRGVYPTQETARRAIENQTMYVIERAGRVAAAGRIDRAQDEVYEKAHWGYPGGPKDAMVLHTLVVEPAMARQGLARRFVACYEAMARAADCPLLRMDTNERNLTARALYKKLGYREADVLPCSFNGIENVRLVCLEKLLAPPPPALG